MNADALGPNQERIQNRTVYGIDFSGAAKAGRKIWIAHGADDAGVLRIDSCVRACDLPNSGRDRDVCLAALREFFRQPGSSVYGLDFPFGLPAPLVDRLTWTNFIASFQDRFSSPLELRRVCTEDALREMGGKELRRRTDRDEKTPFSPYNIRLCRQTFYGIRDLLAPLVGTEMIRVLPMQNAHPDLPIVVEICPASTLKRFGLAGSYKGRQFREGRKTLLQRFAQHTGILISDEVWMLALDDPEGDALDAIIAAEATYRSWLNHKDTARWSTDHLIEGFVFS